MLELRDPQLELFEIRPRDESELLEEPIEAGAGSLGEPHRLAAPAMNRLLDHLARLVAADTSRPRQLVGERIRTLRSQRDGADRREPRPLERLQDETAVIGGHAAWRGDAAAAVRASTAYE